MDVEGTWLSGDELCKPEADPLASMMRRFSWAGFKFNRRIAAASLLLRSAGIRDWQLSHTIAGPGCTGLRDLFLATHFAAVALYPRGDVRRSIARRARRQSGLAGKRAEWAFAWAIAGNPHQAYRACDRRTTCLVGFFQTCVLGYGNLLLGLAVYEHRAPTRRRSRCCQHSARYVQLGLRNQTSTRSAAMR